jgi:hypothetical protein
VIIKPTGDDWHTAKEVHGLFAARSGSDHIASVFSLAHLCALVRARPLRDVLEFGSGIGTITYLLLRMLPSAEIMCAERAPWCREQFERNLPTAWRSRVTLLAEGRPRIQQMVDLVVIDGPAPRHLCGVRDGTLLFIEGERSRTRERLAQTLADSGLKGDLRVYPNPVGPWKLSWRRKGFGFRVPRLARNKRGCWIGAAKLAD